MLIASELPTHQVADWLLKTIDGFLNHLGLQDYKTVEEVIYIIIISAVSIGLGMVLKKLVLLITNHVISVKQSAFAIELKSRKVFLRCSHIIPPLFFMAMIPFAFNEGSQTLHWIFKVVGVYALIAFGVGITSILQFAFDRYNARENRKNLPLRGVLNIIVGAVWIIITILCVCILLDRSPAALLAGLGAFAAALMLIFKDSILGFVAGIQMSDNDMLHVGDWIIVPGTPANGIVMDVSLSTVKIQNWDLTTVMVPPYTLVSTSFQNYRSMYSLGARRIENSVIVDVRSIRNLSEDDLTTIVTKYPELNDFVNGLKSGNKNAALVPGLRGINGTIETNLGLFRAYTCVYLSNHPNIATDRRILVRLMQGSETGIPLQIWCFSSSTDWNEYESVQSEIMEHLSAVAPDFGDLKLLSATNLNVTLPTPNVTIPQK